jgi:hypothetical protein
MGHAEIRERRQAASVVDEHEAHGHVGPRAGARDGVDAPSEELLVTVEEDDDDVDHGSRASISIVHLCRISDVTELLAGANGMD